MNVLNIRHVIGGLNVTGVAYRSEVTQYIYYTLVLKQQCLKEIEYPLEQCCLS